MGNDGSKSDFGRVEGTSPLCLHEKQERGKELEKYFLYIYKKQQEMTEHILSVHCKGHVICHYCLLSLVINVMNARM